MLNVTIDYSQITGARMLFQKYPERLKKNLLVAMKESLAEVTKELKERVPVKTGTLRRSWNPKLPPKANDQGGYDGKVASNLRYAAFMEFGFHDKEQVKAHTRQVGGRSVFGMVAVQTASGVRGGADTFASRRRKLAQGITFVKAHSRKVDFAGKPYARPGLLAAQPAVEAHHNRAVRNALKEDANV